MAKFQNSLSQLHNEMCGCDRESGNNTLCLIHCRSNVQLLYVDYYHTNLAKIYVGQVAWGEARLANAHYHCNCAFHSCRPNMG
jgi:hypothetical protein